MLRYREADPIVRTHIRELLQDEKLDEGEIIHAKDVVKSIAKRKQESKSSTSDCDDSDATRLRSRCDPNITVEIRQLQSLSFQTPCIISSSRSPAPLNSLRPLVGLTTQLEIQLGDQRAGRITINLYPNGERRKLPLQYNGSSKLEMIQGGRYRNYPS